MACHKRSSARKHAQYTQGLRRPLGRAVATFCSPPTGHAVGALGADMSGQSAPQPQEE
jgi:hypothetical protein